MDTEGSDPLGWTWLVQASPKVSNDVRYNRRMATKYKQMVFRKQQATTQGRSETATRRPRSLEKCRDDRKPASEGHAFATTKARIAFAAAHERGDETGRLARAFGEG